MDQQALNAAFYLDQVNHDELLSVLLSHFGGSSHPSLSRVHTYTKREDQQAKLEVEVGKDGRIKCIILGEACPETEIKAISNSIKEKLIDNQFFKIAEAVGFAVNSKVDGFFKYGDEFQILPVPEDAPTIDYMAAGDQPFLLQFKYVSCPDIQIDGMRRREQEIQILRILHLFTKGRIKHASPFTGFAWVIKGGDDPSKWTSEYRQEGYFYKSTIGDGSAFSDTSKLIPIDEASADDYFSYRGGHNDKRSEYLLLPNNLPGLFTAVESLNPKDRATFAMACAWFYYSNAIWLSSHSASFVALITALESLIEKPLNCEVCGSPAKESIERCEKCNEPRYRLTKNFNTLLEERVPFIDEFPREKKLMYSIRSKLAHGLMLFGRDMEPGNWMSAKRQEQDELSSRIQFIAFTAIYNWLTDELRHSEKH